MMDRETASNEPLYQKLVATLRREIREGRIPVGSRLPSEGELCRHYALSRFTVREALRRLRESGLVAARKGAGTTVIGTAAQAPYVHEVASIGQLVEYATGTQYEPSSSKLVRADRALAERLGCKEDADWMRIEALRFAPGRHAPICWMEVYVHADYANVVRVAGRRPGPIYSWIEDLHGERITEIEQVLSARAMPAAQARKLGVKPRGTAIEIRRTYRNQDGKIVEIAFNLHPAERFRYAMTLRRERPG